MTEEYDFSNSKQFKYEGAITLSPEDGDRIKAFISTLTPVKYVYEFKFINGRIESIEAFSSEEAFEILKQRLEDKPLKK